MVATCCGAIWTGCVYPGWLDFPLQHDGHALIFVNHRCRVGHPGTAQANQNENGDQQAC